MGGIGGLMGLGAKLNGAGVEMSQIPKLGHEIFAYAEAELGPKSSARSSISFLASRSSFNV